MSDLLPSVRIQGLLGWIELEDEAAGYELHADSFASKQVSLRKTEAEGDWVEGSYTTRAVKGNITEPLVVLVTGTSVYECQVLTKALTDALEQLQFSLEVTLGDSKETWRCFASEYTIESSQPLMFADKVIVRASVPHLPTVVREQV